MADVFDVRGPLASRWLSYGGADGPFGPAVGPEEAVPGRNGRRQRFQSGEIATSSDQQMTVSVFHVRNEACFDWEQTGQRFELFRYGIAFNGVDQGQSEMQVRGITRMWTRLQGAGEYAFTVKGCHRADDCPQGFTIPVRLQYEARPETPDPGGHPVSGLIADRWRELGAWDGPLGKATTPEGFKRGIRSQRFERGSITTAPEFGPGMVVAAFLRQQTIELHWGGADRAFNAFRVDIYMGGRKIREELVWLVVNNTEWARTGIGSGRLVITDPVNVGGEGTYIFFVFPVRTAELSPTPNVFPPDAEPTAEAPPPGSTPPVRVEFKVADFNAHIGFPPLNGTPAQAFASHASRITDIARHYAPLHPVTVFIPNLKDGGEPATEDEAVLLTAHLHTLTEEPDFRVKGELPSRLLIRVRLRQLKRGQTGTSIVVERVPVRAGDYDMALKGLLMIALRYGRLLSPAILEDITSRLVPDGLMGDHDPGVESIEAPVLPIGIPESENHLLMTESCRFLNNRLLFERTGDPRFDNETNGLGKWLLTHLQRLAQHDFLEFNARPYSRLSLHALMNLHEFAGEHSPVRIAAQIVLDYVMVKFAVSSSRYRRIGPFRRLRRNTNSPSVITDPLMDGGGDPVTGFFMMYAGLQDRDGKPADWFPGSWEFNALIAGLAAYRPPPAAYHLAMLPQKAAQHTFHHGTRPRLTSSPEIADGGVEIYFRSPSFLLSGGGMLLNSGYGENPLESRAQVAVPGALTLIAARADVPFAELIRFDPFPMTLPTDNPEDDPLDDLEDRDIGVNTGVHKGFACGANLRIPDRWFNISGASREGPWTLLDLNRDVPDGKLGFYVAAYRTLPPIPDFNPGLDNYGFLFAMEAGGMDFATFSRETLARNAALPVPLSTAVPFVFTTPLDSEPRRFTFLILPRGSRYGNRIVQMDEERPPQDFKAAPLVDGPWLRSPSGHDGLIEVHDPSCAAPLVLDYRDPARPARTDNATACPQPWIDRNQALIDLSGQMVNRSRALGNEGKHVDAILMAQRAVATLRQYAPRPDDAAVYWPFFPHVLWNVSLRQFDAGRVDDALGPAAETVAVCRRAAGVPGVDLEPLGDLLFTISNLLTAHARPVASVEPVATGADIFKAPAAAPAATAPITWRFALLTMLWSQRLVEAGRDGADALGHAVDAVAAFRQAATSANANITAISGQLFTLSNQLSARGNRAEAVAAMEAGADVLRPVVASREADAPTRARFAVALLTLVMRLFDASRDAEAVQVGADAIEAYQHAADAPDANVASLVGELFTLHNQLVTHAHPAEAAAAVQAAADLLRPPASSPDSPAATRSLFAVALDTLARRLIELRRTTAAEAAVREGLRVCQRLVEEDPVRFGPQLASVEQLIALLGLE